MQMYFLAHVENEAKTHCQLGMDCELLVTFKIMHCYISSPAPPETHNLQIVVIRLGLELISWS